LLVACIQSDDEGLEEEPVTDKTFERFAREPPLEDASDKVYASLQMQVRGCVVCVCVCVGGSGGGWLGMSFPGH
jgi:hypothetical protein